MVIAATIGCLAVSSFAQDTNAAIAPSLQYNQLGRNYTLINNTLTANNNFNLAPMIDMREQLLSLNNTVVDRCLDPSAGRAILIDICTYLMKITTITSNFATHQYQVYMIFKGTISYT